jgi:hypothetical protein
MRGMQRSRQSRGLLSGALDVAENVAGMLPGAISGLRSMFSMKSAEFSTPASFAVVTNNISQIMPAGPVEHPTLGVSGVRYHFIQPLCVIRPGNEASGPTFFAGSPPLAVPLDPNHIAINPLIFGGSVGIESALHAKYVFRGLKFVYTTQTATTQEGQFSFNIEEDFGRQVNDFNTSLMSVPSLNAPYRIPKAELDYIYDGPELFYVNAVTGGNTGSTVEARQVWQGFFEGWPADVIAGSFTAGRVTVEGIVDFYEPIPPTALLGSSVEEREALALVRSLHKRVVPTFPCWELPPRTPEDIFRDLAKLMAVKPEVPPSCAVPSPSPDPSPYWRR